MLFDSSLRKDLSRTFGATLIVILTIVLTMFLIRTLGQAASGGVSPQDVVLILGYTALGHLSTMLSMSLFIAVVVTLGRMYRDSEMTIWFASGHGLTRFIKPVLQMGGPVLAVVACLTLFIYPWTNQQSEQLKARFEKRSDLSRVAPGQFQSSRDGSRVFFIDREVGDTTQGGNVFILSSQPLAESVTTARSGHIETISDAHFLVLNQGQRHELKTETGEATVSRFESYQLEVGERPRNPAETLPPKARTSLELLNAGPQPKAQGELTWRFGLALGSLNLMLLGIGLSATQPRRASNWNLLFALLTFVVYYNLITLSQNWVERGKFSMLATLVVMHGGAFTLAITLMWWRDHGTPLLLKRR